MKDFLATAGAGLTSQFIERAGRKLLGGLLGAVGGGCCADSATRRSAPGMSFASTYALGHVAKRYYPGGRTLSADMLKEAYSRVLQEGQAMRGQYLPAIQDTARTLTPAKVMAMVRGA